MTDRRPTNMGAKRCLEWITACKRLGWPKESIPKLVDLWWEYHDDNGELIQSSSGSATGEQT